MSGQLESKRVNTPDAKFKRGPSPKLKPKPRERGIALIFVVAVLLATIAVIAEFQLAATLDESIALSTRDGLQAEYNALSAIRIRQILLKEKNTIQQLAKSFAPIAGGGLDQVLDQVVDSLPVDCGILNTIITMSQENIDAEDAEDETKYEPFFLGDCSSSATSEHSKISISILPGNSRGPAGEVQQLLTNMFSEISMERHFQEPDAQGVHAESPAEMIGALADWVDTDDDQQLSPSIDEARPYDDLENPYQPKNAPFDSVSEIQMVHGIDDELYAMLKNQVTIYTNNSKILLSKASFEQILKFGLLACFHNGLDLNTFLSHPNAPQFVYTLQNAKAMGLLRVSALQQMIVDNGLENIFDRTKISQVFTDRAAETFYTIEAVGSVDASRQKIRVVYQTNENRFYYFRYEY